MYAVTQHAASQNSYLADIGGCGTSLPQGDGVGTAHGIPLVLCTVNWTLMYDDTLHSELQHAN